MTSRRALFSTIACSALVLACPGRPKGADPPDGAPVQAKPNATGGAGSAAAPTATSGRRFGIDINDLMRGCKLDADCQVIASCDCDRCIPSKKMEVGLCAQPWCKKNACDGHSARCDHGLCSTQGFAEAIAREATPAVLDDLTKVGQLLLDNERVAVFYHEAQRPERVPLVVAWEPGVPTPAWTKFGRAVVFSEGVPAKGPFLLPTQVMLDGDNASLTFSYAVEGASFHGDFVRRGGAWTLRSIDVYER